MYQTPAPDSTSEGKIAAGKESAAQPTSGGVLIIADRGSVAAQHIGEVTMNAPPRNSDHPDDQTKP